MNIAIASVALQKTDGPNIVNSMTQHYRQNVSKNEMIGIATQEALKLKPGFGIVDILVDIIDASGNDYAYLTIEDYEKCFYSNFKATDAFRMGWNVARTKNDMFKTTEPKDAKSNI